MPFIPSKYQQAIFDFVRDGEGSGVVIAVAGSGKTTTIIEALPLIPRDQSAQLFAFNTAIAGELKLRIAQRGTVHCQASTFHSVGFRAVCRFLGLRHMDVNDRKLLQLFRAHMNPRDREYQADVCKLVTLAKGAGVGALVENTTETWKDIIHHHEITFDQDQQEARAIEFAMQLLEISNKAAQNDYLLDYADQLYLPVLWDLPLTRHDWVIVDEAQDTNAIRRAFIRKSITDQGRVLAVGDPCQAIYGFTGASVDAIDLIKSEWDATELPLSVSYRCPQKIVKLAQRLVPYLEHAPDAAEGKVSILGESFLTDLFYEKHDAILCRNNAPLVSLAYKCLGDGVPCRILGRDIGKGLTSLVDKMHASDLDDLERRLDVYEARETAKLREKDEHGKAENLADRVSCLRVVCHNLPETERDLQGLTRALDTLFGDEVGERLTLSTVHKAKGKEWSRVGILEPGLMPSMYARQDWQKDQERNLQYVAWTRPLGELVFFEGGHVPWKPIQLP